MTVNDIIIKLKNNKDLPDEEFKILLENQYDEKMLFSAADEVRRGIYSNKIYIRGLIEFTNYCKNNCFYCGLRRDNKSLLRYRLSREEILSCCEKGYALGFRTFVLQGGEDIRFDDGTLCDIIKSIKSVYTDCAVTLSLGEKSFESYKKYFDAGADRYLLRHETADSAHYGYLHPAEMSLENRKRCLFDLKKIGYQVGSGFMVSSPGQTTENLIADLRFLRELQPDMIGIGPFIHHKSTPFAKENDGSTSLTLRLISILRLMFPHALIPATTALNTLTENGREMGILAGANVIMPNLSPQDKRELYSIYENKAFGGNEDAENIENLKKSVKKIGYEIVTDIGNVKR